MKYLQFSFLALVMSSVAAFAASDPIDYVAPAKPMGVTADKIQVDNVTKTTIVSGNVTGKYDAFSIRGDKLARDAEGTMTADNATVTTCTNEVGHTHWDVTGNVVYRQHDYIVLRDMWLHWQSIPILWLPYFYYPLDTNYGLRVMAGYSSLHRAYIQAKYVYTLYGNSKNETSPWLGASTRVDWWQKNGVGIGQSLHWGLGDFGLGKASGYYIADDDYERYFRRRNGYLNRAWESPVHRNRYYFDFKHDWQVTERDRFRVKGEKISDSRFRNDFFRNSFFSLKNDFLGYTGNTIAWEHNESTVALGAEVTGPLDDFYTMTGRLPEVYFDISPQPIFDSPFNYESQTKVGYMYRQHAEYDGQSTNPIAHQPGIWADYETARVDTYHRITMPFRTANDVLSVVPRVGYHGTFWDNSGHMQNPNSWYLGNAKAKNGSSAIRSIGEAGVTFAARGSGFVNDNWSHMMEPYFDVLAQKAKYSGLKKGDRPYIFDSIDASVMWEDQFAGRGRNLPYTYYGITPGFRNAWSKLNDRGDLKEIIDVDFYIAMQFNKASRSGEGKWHELSKPGEPNYGSQDITLVPGYRVRYRPTKDTTLVSCAEYDSENDKLALLDLALAQKVSNEFDWYAKYAVRDFRWWDFSSTPYHATYKYGDNLNRAYVHNFDIGYTHRPLSWLHYSPFLIWDVREGYVDRGGAWIDYLTDCIGYRFQFVHTGKAHRLDGHTYKEDWNFSFIIYLRAMGTGTDAIFKHY